MTTGWIMVNIALGALVSAIVAGVSVLVPLRLDRSPAESLADASIRGLALDRLPPLESPVAAIAAV